MWNWQEKRPFQVNIFGGRLVAMTDGRIGNDDDDDDDDLLVSSKWS